MKTKQAQTPRKADKAAINEATLKNLDKMPARIESKDDKRFTAISLHTYVSALSSAMVSARYALLLELSVSLAVYHEHGGTTREAKRSIAVIYTQAGWNNQDHKDEDYKTVQRRIGVAGQLFDWLGADHIGEWLEGAHEMQAIQKINHALEEYDLRGINSVLNLIGKPVKRAAPKEKVSEEGQPEKKAEQKPESKPEAEQQPQQEQSSKVDWTGTAHGETEHGGEAKEQGNGNVTQLRRRTDDVTEEGTLYIITEHMKIAIPPETTREELIKCAQELLLKAYEIPETPTASAAEPEEEEGDNIGNKEQKPLESPSEVAAKINQRQAGRKIK